MSDPAISVVIPAYDEQERLPATLEAIGAYFDRAFPDWELVIVDDGSRDRTAMIAEEFLASRRGQLIRLSENRGKGGALRAGMVAASGRWVLMTDADLSTPLEVFDCMSQAFEQGDVVLGSRRIPGAVILEQQPAYRIYMGRVFTALANLILLTRCSDFTCGFKVFRREAAGRIFRAGRINGWGYDAEVVFLAHRFGYRIVEVPVTWENDPRSRVRIVSATIRSFVELLEVRLHDLLGHYRGRGPRS